MPEIRCIFHFQNQSQAARSRQECQCCPAAQKPITRRAAVVTRREPSQAEQRRGSRYKIVHTCEGTPRPDTVCPDRPTGRPRTGSTPNHVGDGCLFVRRRQFLSGRVQVGCTFLEQPRALRAASCNTLRHSNHHVRVGHSQMGGTHCRFEKARLISSLWHSVITRQLSGKMGQQCQSSSPMGVGGGGGCHDPLKKSLFIIYVHALLALWRVARGSERTGAYWSAIHSVPHLGAKLVHGPLTTRRIHV